MKITGQCKAPQLSAHDTVLETYRVDGGGLRRERLEAARHLTANPNALGRLMQTGPRA
jgi:hypothetical protein